MEVSTVLSMQWITKANEWGQRWRAKHLRWIFAAMAKAGLTPNRLTFIRFLSAPAFIVLFPTYPRKMVLLLVSVSLLDWFDGGLARYLRIESDRGKFWDVLVDHIVYVAAVFALLRTGAFSVDAFAYHLLIVPVTYLLATIKESEFTKSDWLIHPYYTIVYFKPLALLAVVAYVIWGVDYISPMIILLNVAMTGVALFHAAVLARRWAV